jgi:hypothetical protein
MTETKQSRQIRRAAERQAAKVQKAAERVTARRATRAAKKMPALSGDQSKGYPKLRREPFQPSGISYNDGRHLGQQEAARRQRRASLSEAR